MYFVQALRHILLYFFFWIFLSWVDRGVFVMIFASQLGDHPQEALLDIFLHSLRLDISMACYALALPYLAWCWNQMVPKARIPKGFFKLYMGVLLLLCVIFTASNLIIYKEWSEKFSYKAMDLFLSSPKEALASVSAGFVLAACAGILLVSYALYQFAIRLNKKAFFPILPQPSFALKLPFFILLAGFIFLGIRGGVSRSPINPSMAYYSEIPFYNHAATNTYWYLIDDMVHARSSKHPYMFMPTEEAEALFAPYFGVSAMDSARVSLKVEKPNVVLVLLEGFTAQVLPSYGAEPGIAPHFEQLMQEGLLFNQVYATAERSDKGIIGLLSAFPAQASQSIIQSANKQEKLPSLAQNFKQQQYATSFYYGGQSEFYNLKSYVLTHQYDRLIDVGDFEKSVPRSSWGVYDAHVLDRMLQDHADSKEPFFSTIYTLTNHHPFELPGEYAFGKKDEPSKFKSTAFYTDSVIQDFLIKAQTYPWFENTLFVFISDHGHRLPDNSRPIYEPSRHIIPFVLWGPALPDSLKGTRVSTIGSQTDLAATLLGVLQWPSSRYPWSRDLLNPHTEGLAFFNWKDGFGLLTKEGKVAFDLTGRQLIKQDQPSDSLLVHQELLPLGKAILQEVYREFLAY